MLLGKSAFSLLSCKLAANSGLRDEVCGLLGQTLI
uniref:Uncharacterized protein n=1 Tax=Anguilla anguilla TaxID=7936 RepID=A0A0E9RNW1_ANGAN